MGSAIQNSREVQRLRLARGFHIWVDVAAERRRRQVPIARQYEEEETRLVTDFLSELAAADRAAIGTSDASTEAELAAQFLSAFDDSGPTPVYRSQWQRLAECWMRL